VSRDLVIPRSLQPTGRRRRVPRASVEDSNRSALAVPKPDKKDKRMTVIIGIAHKASYAATRSMAACMFTSVRPTSEVEASEAAWFCAQGHGRRAGRDSVYVPWRWSLRRCIERGGDAGAAVIRFHRPTICRPRLCRASNYSGIGYPRRVTLKNHVRIANCARRCEPFGFPRLSGTRTSHPATGHRQR